MLSLHYHPDDNIIYHFFQHMQFGLASQIPRYGIRQNWVEKLGNLGLWTIENFPGKVWHLIKEPRWLTIILTQISLITTSFLFYPKTSCILAKKAIEFLPFPSQARIKFAVYLVTISHIVFVALRAYGRFRHDHLMNAWYNQVGSVQAIIPNNS